MRSMINDINVNQTIKDDVRLSLDSQIIFKSVGVKKFIEGETDINTDALIFDDITLLFSNCYYSSTDSGGSNYLEDRLNTYLYNTMGTNRSSEFGKPSNLTGLEKIYVDVDGTKFVIGYYFKTNNLIVISQRIFKSKIDTPELKVKFLELCQNIANGIKAVKPKKVSTKDFVLNKLTEAFVSGLKTEKDRMGNQLISDRNTVDDATRMISESTSRINAHDELLGFIDTQIKCGKQSLKKSITEIKKLPFIKEVHIKNNGIYMDYNPMKVKGGSFEADVGRIRIFISSGSVKIYNMDGITDGGSSIIEHPHVRNQKPCLGSHGQSVGRMMGGMKLKELAIFFFTYLRSYNSSNPWMKITDFCTKRRDNPVLDEPFPDCGDEVAYLRRIRT